MPNNLSRGQAEVETDHGHSLRAKVTKIVEETLLRKLYKNVTVSQINLIEDLRMGVQPTGSSAVRVDNRAMFNFSTCFGSVYRRYGRITTLTSRRVLLILCFFLLLESHAFQS